MIWDVVQWQRRGGSASLVSYLASNWQNETKRSATSQYFYFISGRVPYRPRSNDLIKSLLTAREGVDNRCPPGPGYDAAQIRPWMLNNIVAYKSGQQLPIISAPQYYLRQSCSHQNCNKLACVPNVCDNGCTFWSADQIVHYLSS
jgi:hypothetical protein